MVMQEEEMTTQEKVNALVKRLNEASHEITLHSESYEILARQEIEISPDARHAFSRRLWCLGEEILAVSLELESLDIDPGEKREEKRKG
jgi:hypothetical protein